MKKRRLLYIPLIIMAISACSINSSNDDEIVAFNSELEVRLGDEEFVFANISDSLYLHSYDIIRLERISDPFAFTDSFLNITVTYGGGEGGCPSHLFILQWNEQVLEPEPGLKQVELGLGHYLPDALTCEALVTDTLNINLNNLLGDQFSDSLRYVIKNIADSSVVILDP